MNNTKQEGEFSQAKFSQAKSNRTLTSRLRCRSRTLQRGHSRSGAIIALGVVVLLIGLLKLKQARQHSSSAPSNTGATTAAGAPNVSVSNSQKLTPTAVNAARELQTELEQRLRASTSQADVYQRWLSLRALGPKAPRDAIAEVQKPDSEQFAASAPSAIAIAPEWARWLALQEAGVSAEPPKRWTAEQATSLAANAWRLEGIALALRRDQKPPSPDALPALPTAFASALRLLQHSLEIQPRADERPTTVELLLLAQAVFRAAPLLKDARALAEVRRSYQRLLLLWPQLTDQPASDRSAMILRQATYVEALASFAAVSRLQMDASSRGVDMTQVHLAKQLTNLLTLLDRAPEVPSAERTDSDEFTRLWSQVASLRALRIARAVLDAA